MIEDMKSRINGSLDENLKMFMYSGVNRCKAAAAAL